MGKTHTTLGSKRDTKVFNYELVKSEYVTWKPK